VNTRPRTYAEFKTQLRDRNPLVGAWVPFPAPAVVEIIGWSGFDFVIIDTEHSPANPETVENMMRAANVSGAVPIVRLRSSEQSVVLSALDMGAAGVQVPMVDDAATAARIVEAARYFPAGRRGSAPGRQARYGTVDYGSFVKQSHDETIVIPQIETKTALANLSDILKVPGLDAIFLGPLDLSQEFGVPGNMTHPSVVEAMKEAVAKCLDSGYPIGTVVPDIETASMWLDEGMTYLSFGSRVALKHYQVVSESFRSVVDRSNRTGDHAAHR